ncbi:MAG: EthD family reductase [Reyranella sp.]|jgi:uncharacterized protein (TIGR02118 family)|nr:EthD family reductase [Reyranella sp.]
MATLVVLYNKPANAADFDKHYFNKHVPLAKKIPGLKKYEVSKGTVATPGGPSDYHLVALLTFDSVADIGAAFASAEGKATAGDLANFAQAGAQLLICDTHPV